MVFSSLPFLYFFLPLVLAGYFLLPRVLRNGFLFAASILFYAWGESWYVLVMLGSIAFNWAAGLFIQGASGTARRWLLGGAVAANLGALLWFKYANFLADNLSLALGGALPHLDPIHLPIGISFFTFQAVSYVVDIARGDVPAQRGFVAYGMYKSLFPQLIAGPIVRYRDVAGEVGRRATRLDDVASGIGRFVVGLGKKVLIANVVAGPADAVFALPADQLTPGLAWYGAVCYALQIYFDFSAYSDMAIGIGRILGFHFLENFNFPYAATSLQDFWRRWHISLSSWFRDYLYIPLGGSRGGAARTAFNLFVVFLLCGFWHGAAWTFIVWGLWHGFFLAAERWGLGALVAALPRVVQHAYALALVLAGWVFFRADSLGHALDYLRAMAGLGSAPTGLAWPIDTVSPEVLAVIAVGSLASLRVAERAYAWIERATAERPLLLSPWLALRLAGLGAIMLASTASLTAGSFNPFIYFRF